MTLTHDDPRFAWTKFYMEFADKLIVHRSNRRTLVTKVREVCGRQGHEFQYLRNDRLSGGTLGDICPFTTMASFNIAMREYTSIHTVAHEIGAFLGTTESPPHSFRGVPTINFEHAQFFGYPSRGGQENIEALWQVFMDAIRLADSGGEIALNSFIASFDRAIQTGWQREPAWRVRNLTLGLSWIRPWKYPSIYRGAARKLLNDLGVSNEILSGSDYINLVNELEERFRDASFLVHSFPELSLEVYRTQVSGEAYGWNNDPTRSAVSATEQLEPNSPTEPSAIIPARYTLWDVVDDGCFLDETKLGKIMMRLIDKKNLILQGPPGTGKTWLAKKLAFALIGETDNRRVRSFQFHPNVSYEDFIRGYRPIEGGLSLKDGPFLKMVNEARDNQPHKYVMVIEEINRGNPAQIFGEMLTLLETDKRKPSEALTLTHHISEIEQVYIPPNMYVIGTMNLADRSIALVDLALRRRFAFVDLEPVFDERWYNWVNRKNGFTVDFLRDIGRWMTELNQRIANDRNLGSQFRIGHSIAMPMQDYLTDEHQIEWFREIIETEIGPLLHEYWFDNADKAEHEKSQLLKYLDERQ